MKKIVLSLLTVVLLLNNCMVVNATHVHSENCYVIQSRHTHSGSETSGGGCYGTANYHMHSGDSISGGGCYGAANYHVHSGNETSGGGCYGTANYHVHSGDSANGGGCYGTPVYHVHEGQAGQAVANGCYTAPISSSGTCLVSVKHNNTDFNGPDVFCPWCNATRRGYIGYYVWSHSECGHANEPSNYTTTSCSYCGTTCSSYGSSQTSSHTYNVTSYDLGCGKTEGSVDYYALSCGKTTATVEGFNMNCGKTTDTVEGYSLNCGKTAETIESYSLSCAYQDNTTIRTVICTLDGNEYAELKRCKINKKYKGSYFKEDIFMVEKIMTDKAPAAIGPYSQGIIAGDFFFASGQIPINPATGNIEGADITAQAELVMKNIGELLKAANLSYEQVVKTSCFLADMNDFAAFNEVYAKYFTGKPARSCVAVKTLPKNVLCEVEVIAYLKAGMFDV